MVLSHTILAACLALGQAYAAELSGREPEFGLNKKRDEAIAANDAQALWAPEALSHEKNASQSQPLLMERSMQLNERQTCNAGYGYCSAFGKCCPDTDLCCSYGYCIAPADTCCPYGACDPGWGCCGTKCAPRDGDCCSDDNYCEKGNICVRIISSGRIVCCTDLQCTAAVVSGTTSYAPKPTVVVPTFTPPPVTTTSRPSSPSSVTQVDVIETWYWTVTWWYYSFWWSTFRATSTVTYTQVFETTTFTTTATDEAQARSRFSALSATLTFEPPASAQTSLASLLSQTPTDTPTLADETTVGLGAPSSTSKRSTTTSRSSSSQSSATPASTAGAGGGGPSAASIVLVQWAFVFVATVAGTLMIVL